MNVLHALGNGDADFFSWGPLFPTDDPRRKAMIRWARFALIGYLVLLAVFIAFKLWVLIYLLVFGGFFARILANLTGAIQHIEHHMYATVPCFNLTNLHKAIASNLQVPQESFLGCIKLLHLIKCKQREKLSYIHVPQFPATAAPPRWR